jgi:hypothetical protein
MIRKTMTKLRAPEPAPAASPALEEQLRAAQAAASEVIEAEAQKIKSSPDGAPLPIDWIRANIRATTRGGRCNCATALAILGKGHG